MFSGHRLLHSEFLFHELNSILKPKQNESTIEGARNSKTGQEELHYEDLRIPFFYLKR